MKTLKFLAIDIGTMRELSLDEEDFKRNSLGKA